MFWEQRVVPLSLSSHMIPIAHVLYKDIYIYTFEFTYIYIACAYIYTLSLCVCVFVYVYSRETFCNSKHPRADIEKHKVRHGDECRIDVPPVCEVWMWKTNFICAEYI